MRTISSPEQPDLFEVFLWRENLCTFWEWLFPQSMLTPELLKRENLHLPRDMSGAVVARF